MVSKVFSWTVDSFSVVGVFFCEAIMSLSCIYGFVCHKAVCESYVSNLCD